MALVKLERTRRTPLVGDKGATFCTLSTGQIVICDQDSVDGEYNLFYINRDGTMSVSVSQIMCIHDCYYYNPYQLLPITIDSTEYLALSCMECGIIRLIKADTLIEDPVVVYRGDIGPICLGKPGEIYMVNRYSGDISLLQCSSTEFTLKRRLFPRNNLVADDICFLQDHNLIVVSSWFNNGVVAVTSSDGHIVWDKSRLVVDDKIWCPNTLTFLPDQGLLLIGDRHENRISILSPKTGDLLRTITLQDSASRILDIHLLKDYLLVYCPTKLSCYSVSISFQTTNL